MTTFRLTNDRLLEVSLQGEKVMALAGAMVAYDGSVRFEKSMTGGEGLLGALKRRVTNEGMALMVASGTGTVWFANQARELTILPLRGEKLFVESRSLLAFDPSLRTDSVFTGLRGAASGHGLFTTTVEGTGNVAVMSFGHLLEFEVGPGQPLFVDPDAFVGHRGSLAQEFVFDVNWKTMVGQSSGESYQLKFTGTGVVYVQPSERK
ncbi:AIM24 family protein [Myxococcota bacterium]|nr:AIM24 family protein [Myxococcota bacterium]